MLKRIDVVALGFCIAFGLAPSGFADPVGPVYPPPGGVTFASSASGATGGQSTGRSLFYTNFDDSALSALFFTFSDVDNPTHSSQGAAGATGNMNFTSFTPGTGIALWTSTANMIWNTAMGAQNIATQLRVQFQPYSGTHSGPLGAGWLVPGTASTAGITTLAPSTPVLDVAALPGTDNYQLWYRYETSGGLPLVDFYNTSSSLGGTSQLSQSGGFYSVAAPEPGSVGLLTMGIAGLLGIARRRSAP